MGTIIIQLIHTTTFGFWLICFSVDQFLYKHIASILSELLIRITVIHTDTLIHIAMRANLSSLYGFRDTLL